jgi:hypothetical protein
VVGALRCAEPSAVEQPRAKVSAPAADNGRMDTKTQTQLLFYVNVIERIWKRDGKPIRADFEHGSPEWAECCKRLKAKVLQVLNYDYNVPLSFERDLEIDYEDVEFTDVRRVE